MNRHLIIVLMSILLLSPSYSAIPLLTVSNAEDTQSTAVEGGGIGSSEEENIDSFDVHPESGRWNTTLDDSLVDIVIDSQFENLVLNNDTLNLTGYEMNRGTVKTDGKFEWRMKSDGSGNKTEYYRDQINDEADFNTPGDVEGYTFGASDTLSISADNGILTMIPKPAKSFGFIFSGLGTTSLAAGTYSYFEMRMSTNMDNETKVQFKDAAGNFYSPSPPVIFSDGGWEVMTFDISTVNNFDVDHSVLFDYRVDDVNDTSPAGLEIYVDYIKLIGELADDWNDSDSVIGLMDSVGTPLLNISTHFFGNNTGRFEFELLDSTGALSYHWYSDLFDDLNQFIIGKATFDVLRSKLEITITAENNSRIDKITFPNEFIVDSGLTPSLFDNEIAPYIFISTHTIDHSWQRLFLDWIKADYKEREWRQTDIPTDTDYIEDNWDHVYAEDDIDETAEWRLTVPLLDSFSGKVSMRWDNASLLAFSPIDEAWTWITLYGVETETGSLVSILQFYVITSRESAGFVFNQWFVVNDDGTRFKSTSFAYPDLPDLGLSFSVALANDRSIANLKFRFWEDLSNESNVQDTSLDQVIADVMTNPSQEFVISIRYKVDFRGNTNLNIIFDDFGLTERDIFSDIANAVVEPLGNFFTQLFAGFFKFIAGIFKTVGDVLGVVFVTVGTAITGALTTLQTVLGTAIGLVETAIATLETALGTAIGLVETAIGTLETAIDTVIGTLQTAIETVIGTLQDAFETAIALVQDAVEGVFVFLIAAMADIIDEIITVLLTVIADIIDVGVGIFFFLWDAVGFPDLLAIIDLVLVNFVEVVNAIPAFITQVEPVITGILSLGAVIGVIFLLILPAISSTSVGEFIEKFIEYFFKDVTMGASLLGFQIPVPIGLLWMLTVISTVLSSTIFGGFF